MCVATFCSLLYRPIHDAIERNSLDIVKLLIENGADITVEREGKTLLDVAEHCGFQDVIDYLEGLLHIIGYS